MGFLKKIIKAPKKLASYLGKVVKGAQNGGLLGAAGAAINNFGPRKKKTKAQKSLDAKGIYKNALPESGNSHRVSFQNDKFVTS